MTLCWALLLQTTIARAEGSLSTPDELKAAVPGSEFITGNKPGAVLMRVNLWGAVGKPGVHHVPTQTDLVTLLSVAGGPTGNAQMEELLIKRWSGEKQEVITLNLAQLLKDPHERGPAVQANDIIYLPEKQPIISNNVLLVVGLITGIVGLALTTVLLVRNQ